MTFQPCPQPTPQTESELRSWVKRNLPEATIEKVWQNTDGFTCEVTIPDAVQTVQRKARR